MEQTSRADIEPYEIKGELPDRFPRGWFCIGADYEFTSTPRKLDYFGTSIVAYRGADSGKVHILDAYCPHMGANLASEGSLIVGDSVVCPFHAWHWGGDGYCKHIPYAKKIPVKARIKSWQVMEENQLVFLWFDPDGGGSIPEQAIPRDEEVFEEHWTPWVIRRTIVKSNSREVIDNMADKAHFIQVHGSSEINHFTNISEGHKYTQLMKGWGQSGVVDSEATYHGPSYMLHRMTITPDEEPDVRSLSLVMNVPTSLNSFEFLAGFKYLIPPGMQGNIVAQIEYCNEMIDQNVQGVFADLAIWKDKVTIDNPVLCDGDGPVHQLRRWYNQFLVAVNEVPEALKERKVYENHDVIKAGPLF
ncbi:Rieske 2Fe-2S domain-containing protein [Endozoicomonas arenosclerae]|uniref:Rieske 2Fe-2S domain-containing protein n=1 Tax=Endozoicomonas arenosclerae TaxID=1633495 RepID=UPI0007864541|nr:Rieske 2Fe-2S domain-containing protein [Endozoicomonas arenosclerae]